jgi:hypothetical protein
MTTTIIIAITIIITINIIAIIIIIIIIAIIFYTSISCKITKISCFFFFFLCVLDFLGVNTFWEQNTRRRRKNVFH